MAQQRAEVPTLAALYRDFSGAKPKKPLKTFPRKDFAAHYSVNEQAALLNALGSKALIKGVAKCHGDKGKGLMRAIAGDKALFVKMFDTHKYDYRSAKEFQSLKEGEYLKAAEVLFKTRFYTQRLFELDHLKAGFEVKAGQFDAYLAGDSRMAPAYHQSQQATSGSENHLNSASAATSTSTRNKHRPVRVGAH